MRGEFCLIDRLVHGEAHLAGRNLMEQDGLGIAFAPWRQREFIRTAKLPPAGVGCGEQFAYRAAERTPVRPRGLDRVQKYSIGGDKAARAGPPAPQEIGHPACHRPPGRDESGGIAARNQPRVALVEVVCRGGIVVPASHRFKPAAVAAEFGSQVEAENLLDGHGKR